MLVFIVNFVNDKKDETEMARTFKTLDLNKDGVISLQELQIGMAKYLGVDESRALNLARQIFKKVDLNNSGSIDFSGKHSATQNF
jgi:Ca2+-binding EF-hand superfamily protein